MAALLPLAAAVLAATAAPTPSVEYQVKAAFLYNFAKFIDWPPPGLAVPDAPFRICILGADPFGRDIDDVLHDKTVAGHVIAIRRLSGEPQMAGCQIVFVGEGAVSALARPHEGVLTVGEATDFIRRGGMIRFVVEEGKIRFEINPGAAAAARLRISSNLLKLARIVR